MQKTEIIKKLKTAM